MLHKLQRILPLCLLGFLILLSSCADDTSYLGLNEQYLPIQLEKDGFWSLLSKDGQVKYENEFKNQPTVVINGVFSVKEGEGISVYRASGDKPELIDGLENLKFVGVYNDNLLPVCFSDKRISIVNIEGEEQYKLEPIKGKEIIFCNSCFTENMLQIKTEDEKYGFINSSGKCVIQPIYKSAGVFSNNKALVMQDSIINVIDKTGNKLFSFKHGLEPTAQWQYNRYDKICMKDKDGRFYIVDGKGEMTKLSGKIKWVNNFNDKYIIYQSDSNDFGMMTMDGEIVIRPKYRDLCFGKTGELLASRNNQWEILDYSGNVKAEIDFSTVSYLRAFGYIAGDSGNYTIINGEGKSITKNLDFENFETDYILSGWIRSCYIPTSKIINYIMLNLSPEGFGSYKYGTSMKDVVLNKGFSINDASDSSTICVIEDGNGIFDNYEISVNAWSFYKVAYYDFSRYSYTYGLKWNPESKLDGFFIYIKPVFQWKDGINAIEEAMKNAGYTEKKQEGTSEKPIILLTKSDLSVFIGEKDSGVLLTTVHKMTQEWEDAIFNFYKNN